MLDTKFLREVKGVLKRANRERDSLQKRIDKIEEKRGMIKERANEASRKMLDDRLEEFGEFVLEEFRKFKYNIGPDVEFIKNALKKCRKKDGTPYKVSVVNGPKELQEVIEKDFKDQRFPRQDIEFPRTWGLRSRHRAYRELISDALSHREGGYYHRSYTDVGGTLLGKSGEMIEQVIGRRRGTHEMLPLAETLNDHLFRRLSRTCNWDTRGHHYNNSLDYYDILQYGSVLNHFPKERVVHFLNKHVYEAVFKGLGFLINTGMRLIGVTMPIINTDDRGRLHHETEGAVQWRDGCSYQFYNGVRVHQKWLDDPTCVNIQKVLGWDNMEKKRAVLQLIGWDTVLKNVGAKVIQTDKYGELLEVEGLGDEVRGQQARFVRVTCPTKGDTYILRVPPNTETAHAGVANSFGETPATYDPDIQS